MSGAAASQPGLGQDVELSSGQGARGRPLVVLLCGVAGSGKTTYAQQLETEGYVRLSIDEEVWARFGRYGVDDDTAGDARLSAAQGVRNGPTGSVQAGGGKLPELGELVVVGQAELQARCAQEHQRQELGQHRANLPLPGAALRE